MLHFNQIVAFKICTFYEYLVWSLRVSEEEAKRLCNALKASAVNVDLDELKNVFDIDVSVLETGPFAGHRLFNKSLSFNDVTLMDQFETYELYLNSVLPKFYQINHIIQEMVLEYGAKLQVKIKNGATMFSDMLGTDNCVFDFDALADMFNDNVEAPKTDFVVQPVDVSVIKLVDTLFDEVGGDMKGVSAYSSELVSVDFSSCVVSVQDQDFQPKSEKEVDLAKVVIVSPSMGIPLFITKVRENFGMYDYDDAELYDNQTSDRVLLNLECDEISRRGFDFSSVLYDTNQVRDKLSNVGLDFRQKWDDCREYEKFKENLKLRAYKSGDKIFFNSVWLRNKEEFKFVYFLTIVCKSQLDYVAGDGIGWDWVITVDGNGGQISDSIFSMVPKLYKLFLLFFVKERKSFGQSSMKAYFFKVLGIYGFKDVELYRYWSALELLLTVEGTFGCAVLNTNICVCDETGKSDVFFLSDEYFDDDSLSGEVVKIDCDEYGQDQRLREVNDISIKIGKLNVQSDDEESSGSSLVGDVSNDSVDFMSEDSDLLAEKVFEFRSDWNVGDSVDKRDVQSNNYIRFDLSNVFSNFVCNEFSENSKFLAIFDTVGDHRKRHDLFVNFFLEAFSVGNVLVISDSCLCMMRSVCWGYFSFQAVFSKFFDAGVLNFVNFTLLEYIVLRNGGLEYKQKYSSIVMFVRGRIKVEREQIVFFSNGKFHLDYGLPSYFV